MRLGAPNLSRRLKPKAKIVVIDKSYGAREARVTAAARGRVIVKFDVLSETGGGLSCTTTVRRRDETITWARAGTVEADALLAAEALR